MWRFALGRLLRYFSPPLLRDMLYIPEAPGKKPDMQLQPVES